MNTLNQLCDTIQQEISSSLDEGRAFSAEIIHHTECCENCAEFAEFSSGEAMSLLAEPSHVYGTFVKRQGRGNYHRAECATGK